MADILAFRATHKPSIRPWHLGDVVPLTKDVRERFAWEIRKQNKHAAFSVINETHIQRPVLTSAAQEELEAKHRRWFDGVLERARNNYKSKQEESSWIII